jgi:4-hydroxy-3-methylbut-2-enyl diphosphate reductase
MKLAIAVSLLLSAEAFVVPSSSPKRAFLVQESALAMSTSSTPASKKEERLRFMKSEQFHRKGFKDAREKVESDMEQQFKSTIVQELRSNNFVIERDGVKVHLAKVRSFLE